MRSLAIVFVAPLLEYLTNMAESSKPGCVQALIAESAMETLHMTDLHGVARLDVHKVDPAFLCPARHAARGEFGSDRRPSGRPRSSISRSNTRVTRPERQTGVGLQG